MTLKKIKMFWIAKLFELKIHLFIVLFDTFWFVSLTGYLNFSVYDKLSILIILQSIFSFFNFFFFYSINLDKIRTKSI